MGERTKYTPGTFCWTDLTTTDPDGAKSFYSELFGWTASDIPVGEGMVYSMMQVDSKDAAAISAQPQQQRESGAPPAWNSYVSVESADRALERATQLGATVHAPAFDVFDSGRMGVVQDPQGAFFAVWEAKQHIGASVVNGPGLLSWNELATTDMDASVDFYSNLFGWTAEPFEGGGMPYMTVKTQAGTGNGGVRPAMETEPSYWLVYFGTDDAASGIAKATELGGTQLLEPTDIGAGAKITIAQDPQGAVFGMYSGRYEP
jgi:uncharacterized protein